MSTSTHLGTGRPQFCCLFSLTTGCFCFALSFTVVVLRLDWRELWQIIKEMLWNNITIEFEYVQIGKTVVIAITPLMHCFQMLQYSVDVGKFCLLTFLYIINSFHKKQLPLLFIVGCIWTKTTLVRLTSQLILLLLEEYVMTVETVIVRIS